MFFEPFSTIIKLKSSIEDISSPPRPTVPQVGGLEPGDILCKMSDGSATNFFITFGQMQTDSGTHSLFTHAGLATSSTMIAEMDGKGLQHHSLVGDNAHYTYAVFRCRFRQVAFDANQANATLMQKKMRDKIVYNKSGATGSLLPNFLDVESDLMDKAVKQVEGGKNYSLFCSEHVVFCYQVALQQNAHFNMDSDIPSIPTPRVKDVFGKRAWEYSPSYLYAQLMQSKVFDYLGRWRNMRWVA